MPENREYLTTHPWLTFDVTRYLERAPAKYWQLLGGVVALADVLADTPLLPESARRMHQVMLAKGALATTAIEGNTLTEEEALKALDRQLRLPPSKAYMETELMNMVEAFNQIMTGIEAGDPMPLTSERIKAMNCQVLKNLGDELEEGVVPGEISERGVVVGSCRGAPRRDCDYLLDRMCEWLEAEIPEGQNKKAAVVIRALLAHLYLAWIHPFGDGNGRTARLVEFMILCRGGFPAPAVHLLSNHFNDTRTPYYRQLSHASGSGGDVVPFLFYAVQGFYDGMFGQLDEVRNQTEGLIWQRMVHELLPESSKPAHRQRQLAIRLFEIKVDSITKDDMREDHEVFKLYRNCSDRTFTRDLHDLCRAELIQRWGKLYSVAHERILGLMPRRARIPR